MKRLRYIALFLIVCAVLMGLVQNIFYGYVDENGVLHDSLFLPLSFIFAFIGLCLLIVSWLKKDR